MPAVTRSLLHLLSPGGRRARLMIFPYHRVLANEDPLLPGTPSAARFERQLQRIGKYCNPLSLEEGVERLTQGRLPPRAVALTFDDGYANNLEIAAPLLKKYEIPATVFVAVDAVERGIMWNDLIIEAVRSADGELDASPLGLGTLNVHKDGKLAAVKQLIGSALYLPTKQRMEVSQALYAGATDARVPRQMLVPDQLKELRAFGVDIGAHTVNHPILLSLDDTDARNEIADSRRWLRDVTGEEPKLFAYPNGKFGSDYDARHVEIVRSLGFLAAVAADWGCATRNSSLFELPRFKPWEDSDSGFSSRLCKVVAQTYVQNRQSPASAGRT